jgi:uncharacterized repeat protein (TIGR01451 family)
LINRIFYHKPHGGLAGVAMVMVALLAIQHWPRQASAADPPPPLAPCRLAQGQDCDFPDRETAPEGVTPAQVSAAAAPLPGTGLNIYFGDLHSHSGYSDGVSTPAVAYAAAKANGLDFFALTDHDIMLTQEEWADTLVQANAATVNGSFVALRGFEYTHAKGHVNIFNTDTFVRGDDPAYADFNNFYTWLVNQPGALAQFNHPNWAGKPDFNFNNFAYHAAADQIVVLRELSTAQQFFLSLDQGWHVGTVSNSDTHSANWGCCPRMGVLAPALTKAAILDALRARRTFFASPNDPNLALALQANGVWMGSAVANPVSLNFTVYAHDPDPAGQKPLRMALYDNGIRIASVTKPAAALNQWTFSAPATLGHYYYAEAYRDGWYYPAYSSPIWAERPPLAEAGPPQVTAPNAMVQLDGRSSGDPDGSGLAYAWTQETGPLVSLASGQSARPTFTAPAAVGSLNFKLTVTDAGGLNAADTTTVTVTNQPILAISLAGPATATAGEPIDYTLTVTNVGATAAANVVITNTLPAGAVYVSGGASFSNNTVSWTIAGLPAHGGAAQVGYTVTVAGTAANSRYGAMCAGCIPAVGQITVFTNARHYYLPVIVKGYR